MDPQPSFIGPDPMSPMEYDIKIEPGISSPQGNVISQGPPSGPGMIPYSQPSPGGYYHDYQHISQQPAFNNFQTSFMNGTFDDQFYRTAGPVPRFHPYGRSPVPTPSPNAPGIDIKEERLTPNTPEILDLDSQKVLNSNSTSQDHLEPLPSMWRPHEPFPLSNNSSSSICSTPEIGHSSSNLRPSSTGLGSSSSGLGPVTSILGPSPTGVGLSPTGLTPKTASMAITHNGVNHSHTSAAPSSSVIGPSSILGPMPSGLGMSSGLGTAQMSMLPPLHQTVYSGQHSLPPNHQTISVSNNSCFPNNSPMPSYYSQGLPMNSGITNNSSVQFASTPTQSPSPREAPPTEYPSNVKRAKSFKCEDCNKWFTSHGHLKRHYNTTLHKNMTKLNGNSATTNTQVTTPEVTRPPILSPSSKSIGELSTASSHDEESNLSTNDTLESAPNTFQPVGSAFQPPPVNAPNYSSQNSSYPGPSNLMSHINATHPHYNQTHSFSSEQPLTASTIYHGQFSANSAYTPQPPVTGSHFFLGNNFMYPSQQGGLHGPGLHSLNEYPGPTPVDGLNSYRLENDRISHHYNIGNELTQRNSPEPSGDTGSEASMDSSESSGTGPTDSYKCNDCPKTFNRMCYLTQHRSTYHEGEKPFKCGTCGKRFTDEITFTDHQGKHAGEKPYKCEVCPKQFNHKTDLRRHMCLHTGEKPFSCEQCGKGFIRKDHMLKHFQTHRKKALAAAANNSSHSHPSMPPNPPGFTTHPGLHPQTHGSLPHPSHGPRGHPHIVAPTVY